MVIYITVYWIRLERRDGVGLAMNIQPVCGQGRKSDPSAVYCQCTNNITAWHAARARSVGGWDRESCYLTSPAQFPVNGFLLLTWESGSFSSELLLPSMAAGTPRSGGIACVSGN